MAEEQGNVTTGALGDRLLPRVGLGCMGMSEFYGPSDDEDNLAILDKALELGYVHFDTADMYGDGANESLLGRWLRRVPRDRVFLASKFGIVRNPGGGLARTVNNRPDYVRQACERSLARLGVDTLDLYYVHRRDPSIPIEETVGAMAELVTDGKVRHLGLSEVSVETLRRAHAVHPIAAVQTEYSLLSRDPEAELLPATRELGVAFVAYSPLSRGLLTGTVQSSEDVTRPGDIRQMMPRFVSENLAHNVALLAPIRDLAAEKGCTLPQLALAWVLAQAPSIHAIPGTRRERYLVDNFAAGSITLTPAEMDGIRTAVNAAAVAGTRYPELAMRGVGL